jgi:quercetin dioxygenase-like cupin family protein
MKRLLAVLWLTLLFVAPGQAGEPSGITVKELVKSGVSWDGTPLPAYPTAKPEITVLRITIPPGSALPMHKHPVINAGLLLTGELTVLTPGGKTLHLKAGDPIVEVVDTWHYGQNRGKDPAVIIVFYAGTPDRPITVKE